MLDAVPPIATPAGGWAVATATGAGVMLALPPGVRAYFAVGLFDMRNAKVTSRAAFVDVKASSSSVLLSMRMIIGTYRCTIPSVGGIATGGAVAFGGPSDSRSCSDRFGIVRGRRRLAGDPCQIGQRLVVDDEASERGPRAVRRRRCSERLRAGGPGHEPCASSSADCVLGSKSPVGGRPLAS